MAASGGGGLGGRGGSCAGRGRTARRWTAWSSSTCPRAWPDPSPPAAWPTSGPGWSRWSRRAATPPGATARRSCRRAGDAARRLGASAGVFAAVNRGKRSVALDVERPDGRALLHRLLSDADVVVEDLGPTRGCRARTDRIGAGRHPSPAGPRGHLGLGRVRAPGRPARGRAAGPGHGRVPVVAGAHRGRAGATGYRRRRSQHRHLRRAGCAGRAPRPAPHRRGPAGGGQHAGQPRAPAGRDVDVAFESRRLVGPAPRPLHESARARIPHRRRPCVLRAAARQQRGLRPADDHARPGRAPRRPPLR